MNKPASPERNPPGIEYASLYTDDFVVTHYLLGDENNYAISIDYFDENGVPVSRQYYSTGYWVTHFTDVDPYYNAKSYHVSTILCSEDYRDCYWWYFSVPELPVNQIARLNKVQ